MRKSLFLKASVLAPILAATVLSGCSEGPFLEYSKEGSAFEPTVAKVDATALVLNWDGLAWIDEQDLSASRGQAPRVYGDPHGLLTFKREEPIELRSDALFHILTLSWDGRTPMKDKHALKDATLVATINGKRKSLATFSNPTYRRQGSLDVVRIAIAGLGRRIEAVQQAVREKNHGTPVEFAIELRNQEDYTIATFAFTP